MLVALRAFQRAEGAALSLLAALAEKTGHETLAAAVFTVCYVLPLCTRKRKTEEDQIYKSAY